VFYHFDSSDGVEACRGKVKKVTDQNRFETVALVAASGEGCDAAVSVNPYYTPSSSAGSKSNKESERLVVGDKWTSLTFGTMRQREL